MTTLADLPVDIHAEIVKHLPDLASLEAFQATCKATKDAVKSEQGALTRNLLRSEFEDDLVLGYAAWTFKLKPAFKASDFDLENNKRIMETNMYRRRRHRRHPLRVCASTPGFMKELLAGGPPSGKDISLTIAETKGLMGYHVGCVLVAYDLMVEKLISGPRLLTCKHLQVPELQQAASDVEKSQILRALYRYEMITRFMTEFRKYDADTYDESKLLLADLAAYYGRFSRHFTSWEIVQTETIRRALNEEIRDKIPKGYARKLRIRRRLWPKNIKFGPYVCQQAHSYGLQWYVDHVLGSRQVVDPDAVVGIFHMPERGTGTGVNNLVTNYFGHIRFHMLGDDYCCRLQLPFKQRDSHASDGGSPMVMAGFAIQQKLTVRGLKVPDDPMERLFITYTANPEYLFWDEWRVAVATNIMTKDVTHTHDFLGDYNEDDDDDDDEGYDGENDVVV